MTTPEREQSLHYEALLHKEREDAIAQLVAAAESAVVELERGFGFTPLIAPKLRAALEAYWRANVT